MIESGSPWIFHTLSRSNLARSSDVVFSVQGMKWTPLLCQSQMTRIESHPPDLGSLTMKSAVTSLQGSFGIGFGMSFPAGFSWIGFVRLHVSHPLTYSLINRAIWGHQ